MKQIFLFLLYFFCMSISARQGVDISKLDLTEKRTEFTSTGQNVDNFFNALQEKCLYHFEKSFEHFSLIFSSAKEEAVRKADESISRAGEDAVNLIREQARKNIGNIIEKELEKYTPPQPGSPEKKNEGKKVKAIKEEKKSPSGKTVSPPAKKSDTPVPASRKKSPRPPEKRKTMEEPPALPDLPEVF